jgi:hypothetical protein
MTHDDAGEQDAGDPHPGALAPSSASRVRGPRSPSGRQRLSGGGAGGEKGLYFSYPWNLCR